MAPEISAPHIAPSLEWGQTHDILLAGRTLQRGRDFAGVIKVPN